MACPLNPLDCVKDAGGAATDSAVGALADAVRSAVVDIVKATLTWWIHQPSLDVTQAPIARLQALLLPVTVIVAVGSMMWQGIRMTLSRRPDPLFDIGRGLATLAFVTGAGVALLAGSLRAGDAFSSWVLDQATGGHFADRIVAVLGMAQVTGPGLVILLGIVAFFVTLLQWVLLFFRQGSLVILAALLPLAAAGSMSAGTRPWLRRLLAWLLSIVAYKPMVAFIYAAGFTLFGSSNDLSTVVLGVVILALSVVALPAMLRFFSWGVDAGAAHLGGAASGALVGAAGAATAAVTLHGATSGRGGAASEHAQWLGGQMAPAGAAAGAGSAMPVLAGVQAATSVASSAAGNAANAMTDDGSKPDQSEGNVA